VSERESAGIATWLGVRREERGAVLLAVAAFFCVLFAIFLLRPLRDAMGLEGGARNLRFLWSFTLLGTLFASLAFAHVASRFDRARFLSWTARATALVWLAFVPAIAATQGTAGVYVALAFYVVHAVSNVFLVSVFWALLADVFDADRAKRLFGLVAVGGTLGAIAGTSLTGALARWVKSRPSEDAEALWLALVLAAVGFLELSNQLGARLGRRLAALRGRTAIPESALGGDLIEGVACVVRDPYLQAVAFFTFLHGVLQTLLTLQQNFLAEAEFQDTAARTEYFAWTESAAQTLTLLVQLFLTGRLMRFLGLGGALCVLPLVGVVGFGVLATGGAFGYSALAVLTLTLVVWRGLSHATMRPAREALFVPTERAVKYKAKSFTDTFAFRGGDLASAWLQGTAALGAVALAGLSAAIAWGGLGLWLGRRQRELRERERSG
jgi:AAA family ATP:ADP antiporter